MTDGHAVTLGLFAAGQFIGLSLWLIGLGARLTVLEKQVEVFWKGVGFDAAHILHSPNPLHWEMDQLLERFLGGVASEQELLDLATRLKLIIHSLNYTQGEQIAASALLRLLQIQHANLFGKDQEILPEVMPHDHKQVAREPQSH